MRPFVYLRRLPCLCEAGARVTARRTEEDNDTHFALMDKVYRHQRHIYDLSRKYFLFGRDRMIDELGLKVGQCVIEVGCGTARNLIRVARQYPGVRLFGLDASAEMLRSAGIAVERAGLSGCITLARGLAEELTPAIFGLDRPFDHVMFPYSLSMIPDWRGALAAAHRALATEGRIHVVDFGDLTRLSTFVANGLRAWLRRFHVTPRQELLAAVETANRAGAGGQLKVLPGRFAFVWHGTRNAIQDLVGAPVA